MPFGPPPPSIATSVQADPFEEPPLSLHQRVANIHAQVPPLRSALPLLQVEHGMRGVTELYARAAALPALPIPAIPAAPERRRRGRPPISNPTVSVIPVIPPIPPQYIPPPQPQILISQPQILPLGC